VTDHQTNLLALLRHPEHYSQGVELAESLGIQEALSVALEEVCLPHWLALLRMVVDHAPEAAATGLGRLKDWSLDPTADLKRLFTSLPTEAALFELAMRMAAGEWGEVEKRLLDNLDPVWLPGALPVDQQNTRVDRLLTALSAADVHGWVPFYEVLHFAGHEDAAMRTLLNSPLIAHPGIRRFIIEDRHMSMALRRVLGAMLPGAPMSLWELLSEWPEAGQVLDRPMRIQQLREALKSVRPTDPALSALLRVVPQWTEPGDGRLVNGPVLRLLEIAPDPTAKLAAATAICAPIPVGRCSRILRSADPDTARAMLRGLGDSEDDSAADLLVSYADGPLTDAITAEAAEALGYLLVTLRTQLERMGRTLTMTGSSTGILLAGALSGDRIKQTALCEAATSRPDAALAVIRLTTLQWRTTRQLLTPEIITAARSSDNPITAAWLRACCAKLIRRPIRKGTVTIAEREAIKAMGRAGWWAIHQELRAGIEGRMRRGIALAGACGGPGWVLDLARVLLGGRRAPWHQAARVFLQGQPDRAIARAIHHHPERLKASSVLPERLGPQTIAVLHRLVRHPRLADDAKAELARRALL
jgi:hypothetical protein